MPANKVLKVDGASRYQVDSSLVLEIKFQKGMHGLRSSTLPTALLSSLALPAAPALQATVRHVCPAAPPLRDPRNSTLHCCVGAPHLSCLVVTEVAFFAASLSLLCAVLLLPLFQFYFSASLPFTSPHLSFPCLSPLLLLCLPFSAFVRFICHTLKE